MKLGGHRRGSKGFTIVETLIVLAVTSILFVAAVILVSGKQNKTEFTVAINNAKQQIQQTISETQSGFAGGNILCNAGSSAPPTLGFAGSGCIFMGKVIQFGLAGAGNDSQVTVYPVVGDASYINAGTRTESDSLSHAFPVAVSANKSRLQLQNGLKVVGASSGAVGIITSLGSYSGANCNGLLCAGSQDFSLYKITSSVVNDTDDATVLGRINATAMNPPGGFVAATTGVTVCLSSGTNGQSGQITIAGDGSLAVTLQTYNTDNCT